MGGGGFPFGGLVVGRGSGCRGCYIGVGGVTWDVGHGVSLGVGSSLEAGLIGVVIWTYLKQSISLSLVSLCRTYYQLDITRMGF